MASVQNSLLAGFPNRTLHQIAETAMRDRRFVDAFDAIMHIAHVEEGDSSALQPAEILCKFSKRFAQIGQVDAAQLIAQKIFNECFRSEALSVVSLAYMRYGNDNEQVERALALAAQIPGIIQRRETLEACATLLIERVSRQIPRDFHALEQNLQLLDRARGIAQLLPPLVRRSIITQIACDYVRLASSIAENIAERASHIARAIEMAYNAGVACDDFYRQAFAKQRKLDLACQASSLISDPVVKEEFSKTLALALALRGNRNEAIVIARRIQDAAIRERLLATL